MARVILSPQIKPGTWVTLQVSGDDYAFVSPWDSKVLVPSFISESGNFITVYLTAKGDRDIGERQVRRGAGREVQRHA